MYVGVFDLQKRLEQTRKLLKDKYRLKELLDEDIKELEKSIEDQEAMINQFEKTLI
jgi:vacuolar-type H+-ATPase subunit D/Vma8